MLARLFDDRYRSSAAGIHASAPIYLLMAVFVAAVIGLGSGWLTAGVWLAAAFTAELALMLATWRVTRTPEPSRRAIWTCFAAYAVAVPAWSCAGVILWMAPGDASHLAAMAFFAGHLLYIQAHHAHSPGAAVPTLPSVLAPALVPLAIPHYEGSGQVVVCFTLAAVVLHSLFSMYVSLRKSRDLLDAQQATVAASRAKTEFLARMSHEIRTPLNGVLGMAQALSAEGDLNAGHRQKLAVIHQSGEALLAILNDILDISKVEAGRLELEEIAFDLSEAVRGAQQTFAAQAAAKGLGFRLEIEEAAAGTYRGDLIRVRQILYNLLSNALKFTEHGEVSLTVASNEGALELVVADTGIGIEPRHLARMFGRFQQVDSSTTRRYGGSGLGLSICRELAELMGGSVEVQSTPNVGSRFTVILPLERLAATTPQGERPAPASDGPPEQLGVRVLAAEDNPVNQLVLKTLLGQVGVEPVMVADGEAAVEAWRSGTYDLILMDMQMPLLDGMGATLAIRAIEAAAGRARTPILALTANAMPHQVVEYLEAGLDGHVAKPIDAGSLYEAIAAALDHPQGSEQAATGAAA